MRACVCVCRFRVCMRGCLCACVFVRAGACGCVTRFSVHVRVRVRLEIVRNYSQHHADDSERVDGDGPRGPRLPPRARNSRNWGEAPKPAPPPLPGPPPRPTDRARRPTPTPPGSPPDLRRRPSERRGTPPESGGNPSAGREGPGEGGGCGYLPRSMPPAPTCGRGRGRALGGPNPPITTRAPIADMLASTSGTHARGRRGANGGHARTPACPAAGPAPCARPAFAR